MPLMFFSSFNLNFSLNMLSIQSIFFFFFLYINETLHLVITLDFYDLLGESFDILPDQRLLLTLHDETL